MHSTTDIVVVGGGAAGLTVALELQQLGMQTMNDVIVLDAEQGPGGSWRHAWHELPMRMARDLAEPARLEDFGLEFARADPDAPVREFVPRTFAYFEDASNIYIYRPARVVRVTSPRRSRLLQVEYVGPRGRRSTIECRILIDATGHWSSPFVPWVPGMRDFPGRHIPAARLERVAELEDRRVLVVGGGRTAVDLLCLIEDRASAVTWSTRREPEFRDVPPLSPVPSNVTVVGYVGPDDVDPATAAANVPRPWHTPSFEAAAKAPPERAWIPRTPEVEAAIDRGLLRSSGAIARFDGASAEFAGGARAEVDVVVWATGSHASRRHLAPLRLREPSTHYRARSGWNRRDNRVAIVGDGTDVSSGEALAHAAEIAADAFDSLDDLARA